MPYAIRIDRYFAATHALRLPDSRLEPVHGHGWSVAVTVCADELDDMDCVMDFHELERQLDGVIGPWDRKHLNEVEPFRSGVNPSAERVAETIAQALHLPGRVRLERVEVGEATGCTAIYCANRDAASK
jgi:6-pyruvoyltetrahydropterin/6-carboxytetrahydropterin synthase